MQVQTRQRGNCSTLVGKSRGGTPFCRMRKTVFPTRSSPRKTTRIRFGKAGAHPQLALGIAIAPETLSFITTSQFKRQLRFFRFSLRFLFSFIVQFQFASQMWAARPHLANIFEKLLDQKTFICLWLVIGNPTHKTNNEHKFSNLS